MSGVQRRMAVKRPPYVNQRRTWLAIKPQLYHQSTLELSLFAVDAH